MSTDPTGRELFAAVIDDLDHPQEVHVGDVTEGQIAWHRLTDLHSDLVDATLCESREISWTASDGTVIQGLLHLPAGAPARPLPLVTQVHGGPTACVRCEFFFHQRWARPLADAGFAVFVPNYRGSTGFGLSFAEANIGDMGGADLGDVLSGIDRLVEDGVADANRLGICGWSYGGFHDRLGDQPGRPVSGGRCRCRLGRLALIPRSDEYSVVGPHALPIRCV